MSIFTHRKAFGRDLKEDEFIISPSMLPLFFNNPSEWYKSEVLGERTFKGNTSTVLGTICHHIYEQVTLNKQVTREEINIELYKYLADNPELSTEVDVTEILNDYPLVSKEVVNNYIIPSGKYHTVEAEVTVNYHLGNGVYLAGTCDRVEKDKYSDGYTIVDFKTVAKKPNDSVIPIGYKYQLMSYALALKNTYNYDIEYITIVYGVRPQKVLPVRCIVVREPVTEELWDMITETLYLVKDTVKLLQKDPEYAYILFKDYSLKGTKK